MDIRRIRFIIVLTGLLLWQAAPVMAGAGRSLLSVPLDARLEAAAAKSNGALRAVLTAPSGVRKSRLDLLVAAGELRLVDGLVEADVTVLPGQAAVAASAASSLGGRCRDVDPGRIALRCFLPAERLADMALCEAVSFMETPAYLIPPPEPEPGAGSGGKTADESASRLAGPNLTEGIISSGAINWIKAGITGKGVKVGVIDSGFENYLDRVAEGNLPALVTVKNFAAGEDQSEVDGTTPHGTACAEVVYDMAPGCQLYLAKVKEPAEVGDALVWFISQGVQIISSSVGFHNTDPGDGTGVFPDLVALAEMGNMVWVNSAGNERQLHYDGILDPFGITWSGYPITVHLFETPLGWLNVYGNSAGDAESIGPFTILKAVLRWSDWDDVTTDLDLYLARWDPDALGEGQGSWRVVEESTRAQSGQPGAKPVEELVYVTEADATKYGYFVRSYSGAEAVHVELFTPREENVRLAYMVPGRSLNNLAQAQNAVAVGAVDFDGDLPREYSAQGPVNGPGGVMEGGFNKPDICGYSRVSTASYGYRGFTGTSAAAPHVAGAAALLRQRFPGWTAAQLRSGLYRRTLDVGDPGVDDRCGHGRLLMGLPPAEAGTWFFMLLLGEVGVNP